jgi:hypothetical protein
MEFERARALEQIEADRALGARPKVTDMRKVQAGRDPEEQLAQPIAPFEHFDARHDQCTRHVGESVI